MINTFIFNTQSLLFLFNTYIYTYILLLILLCFYRSIVLLVMQYFFRVVCFSLNNLCDFFFHCSPAPILDLGYSRSVLPVYSRVQSEWDSWWHICLLVFLCYEIPLHRSRLYGCALPEDKVGWLACLCTLFIIGSNLLWRYFEKKYSSTKLI